MTNACLPILWPLQAPAAPQRKIEEAKKSVRFCNRARYTVATVFCTCRNETARLGSAGRSEPSSEVVLSIHIEESQWLAGSSGLRNSRSTARTNADARSGARAAPPRPRAAGREAQPERKARLRAGAGLSGFRRSRFGRSH